MEERNVQNCSGGHDTKGSQSQCNTNCRDRQEDRNVRRKKGRKKLEMQSYLLSLILHKSFLVWLGSCWIAKRQDVIAGVSKVDDT